MKNAKSHVYIYVKNPGWAKAKTHSAHQAMLGMGVQTDRHPELKMHIKPNLPTIWNYDEDGNPTTLLQVATSWILTGDMTDLSDDDIDDILTEVIGGNPNLEILRIAAEDYQQFIYEHAIEFGEIVA